MAVDDRLRGLQPDEYRARLMTFVSETLAASGVPGDARECLGRLLHDHGLTGLFDAHGRIRTDAATAALAAILPPVRLAEAPTAANHYGFGSLEAFNNLPPLDRLRAIQVHEHHAGVAAKARQEAEDNAAMLKARPENWSEFTENMRLFWINQYSAEKRDRDAKQAALVAERKAAWKAGA
jgi:hypothetical protein